MTIGDMQKRKKELGFSYETISRLSGLPLSTVQKILGGVTKNPRRKSLQALERVLFNYDYDTLYGMYPDVAIKPESSYVSAGTSGASQVREEATVYDAGSGQGNRSMSVGRQERYISPAARAEIAYMRKMTQDPKQGNYTAADREAFPDERRTELIDGVIYDMAAPSPQHQYILKRLSQFIQEQIDEEECACEVYFAPLDICMDQNPYNRMQPDLFVLCHAVRFEENTMLGTPELVMEILSPSTRRKDTQVKTRKYAEGGVREYWMIDPDSETITVLYLNGAADDGRTKYASIYSFHDRIPVGICKDGFQLDFDRITKAMDRARSHGTLPQPGQRMFFFDPHHLPPGQSGADSDNDPDEPA